VFLSAQNPPIDAARLDIMPPWLWGRAEGVRNFIRTGAQALAPVVFGAVSQYVFGGGNSGLRWTFVVMMVPLSASALFLFAAARRYPVDVSTAAAVAAARPRGAAPPGQAPPARPDYPPGPEDPRGYPPSPPTRPDYPPGPPDPRDPRGYPPARPDYPPDPRNRPPAPPARPGYPQDPWGYPPDSPTRPNYPPDTSAYPPLPRTRPGYPPTPPS
jgi:hypothetical protein